MGSVQVTSIGAFAADAMYFVMSPGKSVKVGSTVSKNNFYKIIYHAEAIMMF